MARSSYCYVVLDDLWRESLPKAAFTVKHELVSWLRHEDRRLAALGLDLSDLRVYRLHDGSWGADKPAVLMPTEELLNG
jgi:hypothetical protein